MSVRCNVNWIPAHLCLLSLCMDKETNSSDWKLCKFTALMHEQYVKRGEANARGREMDSKFPLWNFAWFL